MRCGGGHYALGHWSLPSEHSWHACRVRSTICGDDLRGVYEGLRSIPFYRSRAPRARQSRARARLRARWRLRYRLLTIESSILCSLTGVSLTCFTLWPCLNASLTVVSLTVVSLTVRGLSDCCLSHRASRAAVPLCWPCLAAFVSSLIVGPRSHPAPRSQPIRRKRVHPPPTSTISLTQRPRNGAGTS